MPPKPRDGVAAQSALNIRLTAEDLHLLDQQVEHAARERLARDGDDASSVTRATLIRRWIRDGARARGLLPPRPVQGLLPFAPVAAPVVHEAPVVPVVVAPSAPSSQVVHEAPVVPVAAAAEEAAPVVELEHEAAPVVPVAAAAEEAAPVVAPSAPSSQVVHEAPVVPVAAPVAPRTKRKAPDVDTVRAALLAARAAGVAQRTIADAVGVDPSSLSKFQSKDPAKHRPLSAERLAELAAYLTKEGHLKR